MKIKSKLQKARDHIYKNGYGKIIDIYNTSSFVEAIVKTGCDVSCIGMYSDGKITEK